MTAKQEFIGALSDMGFTASPGKGMKMEMILKGEYQGEPLRIDVNRYSVEMWWEYQSGIIYSSTYTMAQVEREGTDLLGAFLEHWKNYMKSK